MQQQTQHFAPPHDSLCEDMVQRAETLRKQYGRLYDHLSKILKQADPLVISLVSNLEYDWAVEDMFPKLETAKHIDQVERIVHEVFAPYLLGALSPQDSARLFWISDQIWEVWQQKPEQLQSRAGTLLQEHRT